MQTNVFVTAAVGLVGVLLGATVQYFLNRRFEIIKSYQTLRTGAYVDFLRSAAGIAIAQRSEDGKGEAEFTSLMTDAKSRIAIYGSKPLVAATAAFFRDHGHLCTPEAMRSFASVVATMRSETPGGKELIPDRDIGQLLFSSNLE